MKRLVLLAAALFALGCRSEDPASLGDAAVRAGDYAKGIEHFSAAIKKNPDNPAHYANRGNCYSSLGKLDEALQDYELSIAKALAVSNDPKDKRLAGLYYNRGYAYDRAKRPREALVEYEKTIEIDAKYPDAHGNCAWILATCPDATLRDPPKAVKYAVIENDLKKQSQPETIDTLAAAYAASGDFEKAVATQKLAIEKLTDKEQVKDFSERLQLYQQKRAYVETPK